MCAFFSQIKHFFFCKVNVYSLFLSQIEIPNILKQRKQLAKLVLDYDSAKTRYIALNLFSPIIVKCQLYCSVEGYDASFHFIISDLQVVPGNQVHQPGYGS